MRKLYFLFFLTFALSSTQAQTSIKWESDINAALTKAKAAGKQVFVYAYLEDCPACQSVKPYWSNQEVAKKYNEGFINYKLNLAVASQVKFLDERKLRMPSFPQFMFFDGSGNLVHQSDNVLPPSAQRINAVADEGLNPNEWSSNYKKRFEAGDTDPKFLFRYGKYSLFEKDYSANHKVANALFSIYPKENLGTIDSYIILKDLVTDVDNGFFQYWIKNINLAAELEKNHGGKAGGEKETLGKVINLSITNPISKEYSSEKLTRIKTYMSQTGFGEYADPMLWEQEMLAYLREGKKTEALEVGEKLSLKIAKNGPFLVNLVRGYNDGFSDDSYVTSAANWLKVAKPQLKENSHLAEYYYQSAKLNQKAKKAELAKKDVLEALKYAKLAKVNLQKFEELQKSL